MPKMCLPPGLCSGCCCGAYITPQDHLAEFKAAYLEGRTGNERGGEGKGKGREGIGEGGQ